MSEVLWFWIGFLTATVAVSALNYREAASLRAKYYRVLKILNDLNYEVAKEDHPDE